MQVLEQGADLVAIGEAALASPDLARHLGNLQPIADINASEIHVARCAMPPAKTPTRSAAR